MQHNRLVYKSFEYFLLCNLFQDITDETVTSTDKQLYVSKNFSWVPGKTVVVKKGSSTLSSSDYAIDYINGSIKLTTVNSSNAIIKVSYSCSWATVTQAWPDIDEEDKIYGRPNKLITISISKGPIQDYGLELGGGRRSFHHFYLDVFAPSEEVSSDVSDTVKELLIINRIPIIDFNKHTIYTSTGALNTSFNSTDHIIGYLEPENLEDIVITPNPAKISDQMEKGRTLVEIRLMTISDR